MTQSVPLRRTTGDGASRRGVVVIGAGPYGLSVAAHLRAAGIPVRVFGEIMGSWRHAMATGMFLKSTPQATDLSAPEPGGRLADFCRAVGERELTELTPIPCDVFVRYGMWFTERFVGAVDERQVVDVEQESAGFRVVMENGEQIAAAGVVVATGLRALAYVPEQLTRLAPHGVGPDAPVSHTSHHTDLSRYAGRRVAVIGGGQSALESAALLHEAGAQVDVLARGPKVRWGDTPVPQRPLAQRIAHPASPLGPGWVLTGVCAAPQGVRALPAASRLWLVGRALGPSGAWWLRDRVEDVVPVHTRRPIRRAELDNGTVRLVTGADGTEPYEVKADHVLAATGYRIDVDALPFLSPALRAAITRVPGSAAPALSASLEASVPGLYFTGSLAAPTFGPMLRFVAGSHFAARAITRHTARRSTAR